MKKKFLILATLAIALLLVACGGEGEAPSTPLPTESTAPEAVITPSPTPIPASLSLEGGEELDWPCGVPFEDPGFAAVDQGGAERSADVVTEGEVICWKTGSYDLSYCFIDAHGKEHSASRRVNVVPVQLPEEVPTEKVIYLTFDDGPCANTPRILELLDKYDAKATFFIIAKENNEYNYLLPEMEAKGHSIGVHCYEHSYGDIYASEEAFFEDFMAAQAIYYENLGHYASLSRFPGGGATASSYFYKNLEGGFEQVEQRLLDMGVRYFDWNIQESETSTLDTYYIFRNYAPKFDMPIFLQHDARDYSIAALEDMLIWGKENGYEFCAITDSTPQYGYQRPIPFA